jgi:hypothetical protein
MAGRKSTGTGKGTSTTNLTSTELQVDGDGVHLKENRKKYCSIFVSNQVNCKVGKTYIYNNVPVNILVLDCHQNIYSITASVRLKSFRWLVIRHLCNDPDPVHFGQDPYPNVDDEPDTDP